MTESLSNKTDGQLYNLLSKDGIIKEQAFSEIYSRHSQRLYLYCRRLVGSKDEAEDLYQETFLNLLKGAAVEKEMTNLRAYILRIARNLFYKSKRDNKAVFVTIDDLDLFVEDNHLEKKEFTEMLTSSLALLPDEYREALILQTYNGMSYQEIGEFMEAPVTTVRNWIVRSKQKLREILSRYWEIKTFK